MNKLKILIIILVLSFLIACRPASNPEPIGPTAPPATPTLEVLASPTTIATPTAAPTSILPTPTPLMPTPTPVPPTETAEPVLPVESLPNPQAYAWAPIVQGLQRPLDLTHAGDGSGRLFVVEQAGLIRAILGVELQTTPFLDIRDRVGANANEQGLLGLAFHPNYADNGYFFVNYTDRNGDTVIARYQHAAGSESVDPTSEKILLQVGQPFGNHNGGGLAFGPDGYLYIALGDGGSGGDPQGNGQSRQTLLGKILRIDVDHGDPYAIPPENPFQDGEGRPEIWAYGLRNPWRIAFDFYTGDFYVADVGQNVWEEVNYLAADDPGGANFGWDFREGRHSFEGQPPPELVLVEPIAEYDHSQGCSVTGGVVYHGNRLPDWQGVYLYGDYCSGRVWGLLRDPQRGWLNAQLASTNARIASFGLDEEGEVYLVDHNGVILSLVHR